MNPLWVSESGMEPSGRVGHAFARHILSTYLEEAETFTTNLPLVPCMLKRSQSFIRNVGLVLRHANTDTGNGQPQDRDLLV